MFKQKNKTLRRRRSDGCPFLFTAPDFSCASDVTDHHIPPLKNHIRRTTYPSLHVLPSHLDLSHFTKPLCMWRGHGHEHRTTHVRSWAISGFHARPSPLHHVARASGAGAGMDLKHLRFSIRLRRSDTVNRRLKSRGQKSRTKSGNCPGQMGHEWKTLLACSKSQVLKPAQRYKFAHDFQIKIDRRCRLRSKPTATQQ